MKRSIFLLLGYTAGSFGLLSAIYAFLKVTHLNIFFWAGFVFAPTMRVSYHEQYPYQYLLLGAIVYGCIATVWARYKGSSQRDRTRIISILGVMLLTLLISSVPCGMLWVFHDMRAGFFPGASQFQRNLLSGAKNGLLFGWLIFASSIPFNLLSLFGVYRLTDYLEKKVR